MLATLQPQGYRHELRIGVDEVFVREKPCEPKGVGVAGSGRRVEASEASVGRVGPWP